MDVALADVRDVAYAHIAALTAPRAAGRRFILCSEVISWKTITEMLHEEFDGLGYK